MKAESLLRSFERCLKAGNLDLMTEDLYHFFMNRCEFIAHYDIHGFRAEYNEPNYFLLFMNGLSRELHESIKNAQWHKTYTDNTDSFKFGYEFKIPEVKQQMLNLLEKYTPELVDKLLGKHLQNLKGERDKLTKVIDTLEGKCKQTTIA